MKMEVPQVDLPLEVLAWTKVTEDNLYGRKHESLHQSVGILGSPEWSDYITSRNNHTVPWESGKGKSLFCRILREMYRTYQLADHHRERLSQADRTADHPSFREYRRLSEGIFCLVVSCQLWRVFQDGLQIGGLVTPDYSDKYPTDVPELFGKQSFEP